MRKFFVKTTLCSLGGFLLMVVWFLLTITVFRLHTSGSDNYLLVYLAANCVFIFALNVLDMGSFKPPVKTSDKSQTVQGFGPLNYDVYGKYQFPDDDAISDVCLIVHAESEADALRKARAVADMEWTLVVPSSDL